MFCPNCGKQNTDHAIACAFCDHPLERPKPRFKGTMMMNAPATGAAEQGAGSIGRPSDPPPARSPKKTIVGGFALSAPAMNPSSPPAPHPDIEPLPKEPIPGASDQLTGRAPKKTMIGGFVIPPGGITPPREEIGSEPAPSPGSGARAPSPKKTMIGGFAMRPAGDPQSRAAEAEVDPSAQIAAPSEVGGTHAAKKTMIGGFAMPQGGLQAPSADGSSDLRRLDPEELSRQSAGRAPAEGGQWDGGDEDTPASGLTLPDEEEIKRPSAEFDRTLVAGMISLADLPPRPEGAEHAPTANARQGSAPSSETADKLEPALKRSPILLLLSATLIGVFALFIGYTSLRSRGAAELEIEQHRFALEGVMSAILLTCEADPSGGTALETIRLPSDSSLKNKICDLKPTALEAIGDSARVQGKRLAESSVTGFPGSEALDRERCVLFRSGSAMIVTCDTEEIGITPVYFQNIGEL